MKKTKKSQYMVTRVGNGDEETISGELGISDERYKEAKDAFYNASLALMISPSESFDETAMLIKACNAFKPTSANEVFICGLVFSSVKIALKEMVDKKNNNNKQLEKLEALQKSIEFLRSILSK